ncbi:hypothetical protein MMC22_011213 [Lobaria immixta]|nr:hypothetical protein [Lobaria immixta]
MATTMVNGEGGNVSSSGRQQSKSAFNNKALDGNRKQGANSDPVRRNAPQKAWTTGMNPITQRSTTPAQQNGAGNQAKAVSQRPVNNRETNSPEKHAHDRLIFLLGNMIGLPASITVKNGDIFTGIFFGTILEGHESNYLLKMVQQSTSRGETNGVKDVSEDYIGVGDEHAMTFDFKEVIHLAVEGVGFGSQDDSQNGSSTGFRTDTDISGNPTVRERSLQRWEPSVGAGEPIAGAGDDLSLQQSDGPWDQFQANEQKFGLKSDYDENIYTTMIDRSNPLYAQREAEAQRIAQEIVGTTADNAHMREERGVTNDDDGLNEEDKFSSVQRQATDYPPLQPSQGNKYMPPARRLPTSRPTVAGAPVDPAIISSQIARPESSSKDRSTATGATNQVKPGTQQSNGEELPVVVAKEATKEAVKEAGKETKETVATTLRSSGPKATNPGVSATANVETEVLDSFRQFASFEKMRVSDHRRQRVSQDKAIKLNDLMKFSKNFKLITPVPKDLVPILAKDKSKQEEIMEKAQRNAEASASASATTPLKLATTTADLKPLRPLAEAKYESTKVTSSSTSASENPDHISARPVYPPQGPQATMPTRERHSTASNMPIASPKSGQGLLGRRLEDNHRLYKGGLPANVPTPLPIHSAPKNASRPTVNPPQNSSSQGSSNVRTPTSAASSAKFNVKASEFKPNPAANSFKPTGNPSATSSPRSTPNARPSSRAQSPTAFFGNKKPLPPAERSSILENFNPLKRLKEKAQNEGKSKDYSSNGGIAHAYATPPTWKVFREDEENKSYKDMFDTASPALNKASPQQASPVNPPLPHQHQLPLHLQHGAYPVPQLQPPQQAQYPVQHQPHHYPNGSHHYDDHRMHLSASNSSVYPSPRLQNTNMAYASPMPQPAQLAYGQPAPQYVMGPNGPAHFRPFPVAPQMIPGQGPQLAAPMMVQQSSQGSFVAPHAMGVPFNPQMPMYPPGQPPAYSGQSQAPNGYPSPGRAAPMMIHQGSHQGQQQPQMYPNPGQFGPPVYAQQPPPHVMQMRGYGSPQPQYNQSPQQQHHYPSQTNRVQSNNYGQAAHPHMAAQHPPPPAVPMEGGEEAK